MAVCRSTAARSPKWTGCIVAACNAQAQGTIRACHWWASDVLSYCTAINGYFTNYKIVSSLWMQSSTLLAPPCLGSCRLRAPQPASAASVCIGACCRAAAWEASMAVLHSIEEMQSADWVTWAMVKNFGKESIIMINCTWLGMAIHFQKG